MPLDARTDVFSAGIILHEMLTTERLFRGDTEFALMEKVRKAEVAPPSQFNRRVTPELDTISLKALARDVADRYQSAAQLAADLDALIAGYRFDPKELRQFMRQLFRKEYAKELEDRQVSLDASISSPADELSMSVTSTGRMQTQPPASAVTPTDEAGPHHRPDRHARRPRGRRGPDRRLRLARPGVRDDARPAKGSRRGRCEDRRRSVAVKPVARPSPHRRIALRAACRVCRGPGTRDPIAKPWPPSHLESGGLT
jgi:serine/threonine protein kinase